MNTVAISPQSKESGSPQRHRDAEKNGIAALRSIASAGVLPPSAEWKALRAVVFPALKRWASEVASLRDARRKTLRGTETQRKSS
jgi:hypothetical protein